MLACRIPALGKMTLAPMLKDDGKLIGDSRSRPWARTISADRLGRGENYHMRWFESHLPQDGSVRFEAIGLGLTGLAIAVRNPASSWPSSPISTCPPTPSRSWRSRKMDIGMAPAIVRPRPYTGDLGYEIWMKPEYQRYIFERSSKPAREFGIGLFGLRALNSLRLEKAYGSWSREYRPLYGPYEAELGRFIALKKDADFIGKAAAAKEKEEGGRSACAPSSSRPRRRRGRRRADLAQGRGKGLGDVGRLRAWPGPVGRGRLCAEGDRRRADGWQVELLGDMLPARLQATALFDADGAIMRG